MTRSRLLTPLLALTVFGIVGCSQTMGQQSGTAGAAMAPPGGQYKKVSELVKLPDFLPGLGTLYVNPATLPAGPFLAYDRSGKLVSSIYMIPVKDIEDHKKFENLNVAKEKVDHVDMYYNAGHPGVEAPHYHVVLWYVTPEQAAALK